MTLGQVRALCAGLDALERDDQARQITAMRLAFHADAAEVDKYLDSLEPPMTGPDPTDAFLAKYSGTPDDPVA